jgi:tetratricopeptide (TPR) repeat protein
VKDHFSRAAFHRLERSRENTKIATSLGGQAQQAETLLAKANGFFIAGRDTEAITTLTELLRLSPDNADAHLLMGRIQERRSDFTGAVNSLKAAIFWNAKLLPAHVLLGRIYLQQKNAPQAKFHLKQALEINPQDRDAMALERLISSGN